MTDSLRQWLATALHLPSPHDLDRANEARQAAEERLDRVVRSERIASEAKLRSFFEAASQGIIVISADGRIILVNRRTEEMFGHPRSELLGQHLGVLLPEPYRRAHESHVKGYFADPRMRPMEHRIELVARRKDGTQFPAEIGLSHIETEDGTLALALVSDITEKKQVADRLAQAAEEQRRSNADLEQFAYVASHDLQEPLRMVTGYLNMLQRRHAANLDADAQEFIRYAVDGATRMKRMIQDILSLSRVGTQAIHCIDVPASELVRCAIENLSAAIEESSAEITVGALPSIRADAGLVTLVFQNLIGNAIKFRGEDPPRIVVKAVRRDSEWNFSIKDNGIGINPVYIERIFRIFERLHGPEKYPGSGLGLALAKKIVERHGGRISVESKPGGGSTFFFSIPDESRINRAG